MKRSFALVLMALLATASATLAQGPDDQYVRIYNLIQEADSLKGGGQTSQAMAKYLEAQTSLQRFQRGYPEWNTQVVGFRLSYLAGKIAELSPSGTVQRPTAPATSSSTPRVVPAPNPSPSRPAAPPMVAPPPATQPPMNDFQEQLNMLKDQVRQLQVDKTVLESKLREAFTARPSSADPVELAKAQAQTKALQKENDLLKVTLAQEKAKPAAADPKVLSQTQAALAEANRKLTEQTAKATKLAEEKQFLQNKLSVMAPTEQNATALEDTRKALADTKRELAMQREVSAKIALEKEALQARFRNMNADSEAAAALRAENALLKKQLADAKTVAPGNGVDQSVALAQAQAQIAVLRSDKENLLLAKLALENRVKQLTSGAAVASASHPGTQTPAASKPEDLARIKQLEKDRDELTKKLEAAAKELYGKKGQAVATKVEEMENQLGTLRARLAAFEAQRVPYTAEELALFKTPEPRLADPRAGKKSVRELPAGAEKFVVSAQKHYSNNEVEQAEQDYLKALQVDKKNVPLLANLANIELDLHHTDAAETNIKQAITLNPNDAYSYMVLGRLRLQQEKFDEAVDALSKAANLDPTDPQIQNFLGLALNEKGLRGPAETALRKAIQLDPGYPNAHNNLAVMYLTQQPPLVELARWHYQKALAGGFPRNPDLEKMIEVRRPIE
jgi:cytochrome c-type biogenesis protein CcmH/NrfG